MEFTLDDRKLVIEIISTLVNIRSTMVTKILAPAGVDQVVYAPLLRERSKATGKKLTKREMAPYKLDALESHANGEVVLERIISIAANWSRADYALAHDQFLARGTVVAARERQELQGSIEARAEQRVEAAHVSEAQRRKKQESEEFASESALLLQMFDSMATSDDPHRRGYLLQDLLDRVFRLHDIALARPFVRNDGAEQIDGAFKMGDWYYIVECRWRKKLADTRELDGLLGQVTRSGVQTMGLLISINGWSSNVPKTLKQNTNKCVFLMEGCDLRFVLTGDVKLSDLLAAKLTKFNIEAEPYYSASDYINS